ncbi:MAG: DTW domain-containing protein YfiP [Oceanicoccus sp.]
MILKDTLDTWLALPEKTFSRETFQSSCAIRCDCSGFITLLFNTLGIKTPYQVNLPKAVHYFSILQEIGSNHIDRLKAGNILAWRKNQLPKSGDTGHVLLVVADAIQCGPQCYRLSVVDSTKQHSGLAQREIEVHVDGQGKLIGVRMHLSDSKVKRTPIYHHSINDSRFCFGCGLPVRVCGCATVDAILAVPPVIILRHPKERKRTLSTVSLIKQRYPSVLVKEGEVFAPLRQSNLALIFPGGDLQQTCQESTQCGATLILIDATWRKAKKILHVNPWLQALPRVDLRPDKVSDYRLRKVSSSEALSSVEAFAAVMEDKSLADSLGQFMDRQIAVMGESTYRQNYRHYLNFSDDSSGNG